MYAPSTTSTTASGAGRAAAAGDRRIRVVRLLRPRRAAPSFGFSLRGGHEHATGFFISKVEFNSEAQHQGLKVGDQLMSVNGYRVEDAVHSELAHFLAAQSRLKIKVRNVGMIPMKDKVHEAVSWQFVAEHTSLGSDASSSPTLCHDTERMADLRLSILVPPKAKLGCGICKGPEWKPGIFVQFVRDGGIAREAGLRPGDQILSCNGINFANITFNEAIAVMKASGRLELVIREGVGIELVSPESSGYNSSASSAAGERSPAPPAPPPLAPPAALRRRLASVAEEAADRADRLNMIRMKRRTWDSIDFDWKTPNLHNFDAPSDIEPDYDCPSIPNNPHTYENQINNMRKKDFVTSPTNRTIINLTEDGATIQCTYENQSPKKNFPRSQSLGGEEKTIFVEVHHRNTAQCTNTHCTKPPPMMKEASEPSDSGSVSLTNAIAEEIQRRKLTKKTTSEQSNSVTNPVKRNTVPKPVENQKKKQHDALIDEFKKVHQKMFGNQESIKKDVEMAAAVRELENVDRQPTLPLRKAENTPTSNGRAEGVTNGPAGAVTNGPSNRSPPRDAAAAAAAAPAGRADRPPPPPPPPMPATNGHHNGDLKKMINQIQDKINTDLINMNGPTGNGPVGNGNVTRTPTPDYNIKNEVPAKNKVKINGKDEKAELDSLESYKLKNPSLVQPRPPSNYFVKAPNGTATMKKHVRPVSVTIGEYGSSSGGGARRPPSKLDFLGSAAVDTPAPAPALALAPAHDDTPLTNRLQSELALTLSRSNLRKKTDALDNKTKKQDKYDAESDGSLDKNFHIRYGNNILPLPPSISIPKVTGIKNPVYAQTNIGLNVD